MFFYCNKLSNNIIIVKMSGYIVNPFSSDINPMQSSSSQSIPVVAYGLIGITSLTLAYLTMIDSTQESKSGITSPSTSATSMLPSGIFTKEPENKSPSILPSPIAALVNPTTPPPMAQAEVIKEENKDLKPGYGGKSKRKKHIRNKKSKKTKRNKK
jgi:hypothetical protein